MSNLPTSVLESFHDGLKIWCLHVIVLRSKVKKENIELQNTKNQLMLILKVKKKQLNYKAHKTN
jgi:hypothetical protein